MIKRLMTMTSLVATMGLMGASQSWAFNSQQITNVTAVANTVGTMSASFSLSLRDVVNTGVTRANIGWANVDTSLIPAAQDGFKIADTMIQMSWNVTDPNGGIQIYTDNLNGAANPHFVDPTSAQPNNPDSDPAGLLMVPAIGTDSSVTLPVCWSIKSSTQVVTAAGGPTIQLAAVDPNDQAAGSGPGNRYQWLYMKDKGTPNIDRNGNGWNMAEINPATGQPFDTAGFSNGDSDPYVVMAKNVGIHGASGPGDFFADADKISYVYLEAGFSTAAANTTYKSNRVTVEAYIQ